MGFFSWLFGKKKRKRSKGYEVNTYSAEDYERDILKDVSKKSTKKNTDSDQPFYIPLSQDKKSNDFIPYIKENNNEDDDILIPLSEMNKKGTGKARKKKSEDKKEVNKESVDVKPQSEKQSEAKVIKEETKTEPKEQPKAVVKKAKSEPKHVSTKTEAKVVKNEQADTVPEVTDDKEIEDNSPEVKDAVAVQESKATANGKFDIRKAKDGRYFFSLYASNHMVIAYSQIYSSTKSVTTGINSVIANATKAPIEDTTLKNPTTLPCPKWEIYIDKAGQYRFRLYASNGLCVCHASHGYASKGGAKGGIDSIRRFAAEARVDKSYLIK